MWRGIAALPQPCSRQRRLLQLRDFAPPYGRSRHVDGTAKTFIKKVQPERGGRTDHARMNLVGTPRSEGAHLQNSRNSGGKRFGRAFANGAAEWAITFNEKAGKIRRKGVCRHL